MLLRTAELDRADFSGGCFFGVWFRQDRRVSGLAGAIASKGLSAGADLAVATIMIELGVGSDVVAGWKARWAAFLLAVFTAIVTLLSRFLGGA